MEMKDGKKAVVLYLEDWQIRMIKDVLGVDCQTWVVPIDQDPGVRYMVRLGTDPTAKRMYLTEWQKAEILDEAGATCQFIELVKGVVKKYGVPTGPLPVKVARKK